MAEPTYKGYRGSNKEYSARRKSFRSQISDEAKTYAKAKEKEDKKNAIKAQEAADAAKVQEQKDKEWNVPNALKGLGNLGTNIVGELQQGGAKVADVAVKGGAVLENAFEQDNEKVLKNLKRSEELRNVIKSGKDIRGKSFSGTKDISAGEVMSDPRKAAELAGEALDVATSATTFLNPASVIKNAAGETVKATGKQAAKQIAKEAAAFGGVDALAGGARTYGETGDVGKAITEGAKTGAISAVTQGALGGAAEVAGKVLSKGKKTTPTNTFEDTTIAEGSDVPAYQRKRDNPNVFKSDTELDMTDTDIPAFMRKGGLKGKSVDEITDELITPKETAPLNVDKDGNEIPEYLGSFRINKNSKKPVLNEEVNIKIEAAKAGNDLPEHVYDAPVKATKASDVMEHPTLPKQLKVAGQVIAERKRVIDDKINNLYKETDADMDKTALDLDYNKRMEQIDKMPEIRAQIEADKLDAEYTTKLNDIEDKLAQDAEDADKFLQVKDAVDNEELEFVNDVNAHLEIGNEKYRTVNEERKQAYIDELTNQKYEIDPAPEPAKTKEILTRAVTSGEKLSDIADNNTTVQKAIKNEIDEAAQTIQFDPETNTGYTPGLIAKTFTGAKDWLDNMGEIGVKINKLLTDAVEQKSIAETKFTNQIQEWRKLYGGKIDERISKALDGDMSALNGLNDNQLKVYEGARMYFDNAKKALGLPDNAKIKDYFPHVVKQDLKTLDAAMMQLKSGKGIDGNDLTQKQIVDLTKQLSGVDSQTLRAIKKNSAYKIENGFLKQRTGNKDYSLDFEEVMAIYDRSLNKSLYLKPAFEEVKSLSGGLTTAQNDVIGQLVYNIGARPADDFGDQLNKSLQSIFNSENITYDSASNTVRNAIYDSTMGLNFKSAVTNLSQNSNTMAKVGYGNYANGAKQAVESFSRDSAGYAELLNNGVVSSTYNDFLSENKIHNKAHNLLWGMFNGTEQFNRASAYFGGKSKFIEDNLKKAPGEQLSGEALEKAAQQYGKKIAEKTQFKFDPMSTGLNLQSTTAKNLTQFMSYNIKQAKFLKDMVVGDSDSLFVKNTTGKGYHITPEGIKAMARYIGANMVYLTTIGAVIGTKPEDMIPFWNDVKGGDIPKSPIARFLVGDDYGPGLTGAVGGVATAVSGGFSEESTKGLGKTLGDFAGNTALTALPGGAQLKKTVEGAKSIAEGQVTSDSGNIRYLQELGNVGDLPASLILGKNFTGAGREWKAKGMETLSKKQTETINALPQNKKQPYLDYYMTKKSVPSKSEALGEIRSAVDSDPARAARLIREYNEKVQSVMGNYYRKHNTLPDELLDEKESLKIDEAKYLED